MAVRPEHVPAVGCAGRVGRARLDGEDVGPLGVPAGRDLGLGTGDLREGAAEVDGGRAADRGVAPWHRPGQRPVELEDARAVPVLAEPARVPGGQPPAADGKHLPGRQVEQDGRGAGQLTQVAYPMSRLDDTAAPGKALNEGGGEPRRPATNDRPADLVRERGEQQPVSPGDRPAEVDHRVRGHPRERGAAPLAREERSAEEGRGQRAKRSVPGQPDRRAGHRQRGEQAVHQPEVAARSGTDRLPPGGRVPARAEPVRGFRHVPVDEDRVLPVKRVRRLHRRVCPLDVQVEFPERRRRPRQREHRGAEVVSEPVEPGERPAPQPAAGLVRRLKQQHLAPGLREHDGADEPVRSRPDDYRIKSVRLFHWSPMPYPPRAQSGPARRRAAGGGHRR